MTTNEMPDEIWAGKIEDGTDDGYLTASEYYSDRSVCKQRYIRADLAPTCGEDVLAREHERLSKSYHEATVVATQNRDYRPGLAEDLRKRLSDLEYAMMSRAASTPARVTVESNGDLEQSELAYVLADAIDGYDTTAIGGRLLAANHVMKVLADKYPNGLRIVNDGEGGL